MRVGRDSVVVLDGASGTDCGVSVGEYVDCLADYLLDTDPLRRFIDQGLAEDSGVEANLNYWAHWVGEHTATWTTDADMTTPSMNWSGARLLDLLIDGVVNAPYWELCIYTLRALLRRRSHLIRADGSLHLSRLLARTPASGVRYRALPPLEIVVGPPKAKTEGGPITETTSHN